MIHSGTLVVVCSSGSLRQRREWRNGTSRKKQQHHPVVSRGRRRWERESKGKQAPLSFGTSHLPNALSHWGCTMALNSGMEVSPNWEPRLGNREPRVEECIGHVTYYLHYRACGGSSVFRSFRAAISNNYSRMTAKGIEKRSPQGLRVGQWRRGTFRPILSVLRAALR